MYKNKKITKSGSETDNLIGNPSLSSTLVPMGAFSKTDPSSDVVVITGGLTSTGLTVIDNFAVVNFLASVTSSAFQNEGGKK